MFPSARRIRARRPCTHQRPNRWPGRALRPLEQLEARLAPATLVSPTTVSYRDVDGDQVRVHVSRPLFQPATINDVFHFDVGGVTGSNAVRQQLQAIDLTGLAAAGISLSVTVNRAGGGDGLADVGFIDAAGIRLGEVTIQGDLGRIDVRGLNALTVRGLGQVSPPPGGNVSHIEGDLHLLCVESDVAGASVLVSGGEIGLVWVGGSLIGGTRDGSGVIASTGAIGRVIIGQDVRGSAGFDSGVIRSDLRIDSVVVGGSLVGGAGDGGGQIAAGVLVEPEFLPGPAALGHPHGDEDCGLGTVTIAGDIRGGGGFQSGSIVNDTLGPIERVCVGGSLRGGTGDFSGQVFSGGDIGRVEIDGDLRGGGRPFESFQSGSIVSLASIAGVTIGGSLRGGAGFRSGQIVAENMPILGAAPTAHGGLGPVTIGGDLRGGDGFQSGMVVGTGRVARVSIGGSLLGSNGDQSGQIVQRPGPPADSGPGEPGPAALGPANSPVGGMGPVEVAGDVKGGNGFFSGVITAEDSIARVTVGGSLLGGRGENSGQILVGPPPGGGEPGPAAAFAASVLSAPEEGTSLGPVTITGDVRGGDGFLSGAIFSDGTVASVTVRGSLLGGSGFRSGHVGSGGEMGPVKVGGDVRGGRGDESGAIHSGGALASLTVAGSLRGGDGFDSGVVIGGGPVARVQIEGDVRGGTGDGSGTIRSDATIDHLMVDGSLIGGAGFASGQIAVRGGGVLDDVTINGDVRGGAGVESGAILGGTELAALTVGGSVRSGVGERSGSIVAGHLGAITVCGSLIGNAANPVLISAPGGLFDVVLNRLRPIQETSVRTVTLRAPVPPCGYFLIVQTVAQQATRFVVEQAQVQTELAARLDRLTVGGRVEFADVLAGAGGHIGTVRVGGNWVAGNIAAGVGPGDDGFFGTPDDSALRTLRPIGSARSTGS